MVLIWDLSPCRKPLRTWKHIDSNSQRVVRKGVWELLGYSWVQDYDQLSLCIVTSSQYCNVVLTLSYLDEVLDP